ASPQRILFQQMLFSKIVPNCKKLGLLDANGGWLGGGFTSLGLIQFEANADTGVAFAMFQLAAGETSASWPSPSGLAAGATCQCAAPGSGSLGPMPYRSDPRLLVLHGVRLTGVAEAPVVAAAVGLPEADVAAALEAFAASGLARHRDGQLAGWQLTP